LSFRLLSSSLTGLTLLALASLCPDLRLHDPRPPVVVEFSSQTSRHGVADTAERRTVLTATADLDIDDEEQPRVASLASLGLASERLALPAFHRPIVRRAALSHPPCASPPTGPPHA
jgi:hypothetical protein